MTMTPSLDLTMFLCFVYIFSNLLVELCIVHVLMCTCIRGGFRGGAPGVRSPNFSRLQGAGLTFCGSVPVYTDKQ